MQRLATTGILALTLLIPAMAYGQPAPPVPPAAPAAPQAPSDDGRVQSYRTTGARIAIGRNVHIQRDEEVTDTVVVVGGSVRVDGRVRNEIVVIGGNATLGPQSYVGGDVVVVGGALSREDGAQLRGSVSGVSFEDWIVDWGNGWVALPHFNTAGFWRWFALFGAIFRIALLAVLMAAVLVVARAPVERVGRAAAAEPLRAALVGAAAVILFLPVLIITCAALALTIIGIPFIALVIPGALLAAAAALILGFTALAYRIGAWVEERFGRRVHSGLLAAVLGLMLIVGPTLLSRFLGVAPEPLQTFAWVLLVAGAVAEIAVWTIGLGATLMTGFGRWNTQPPSIPQVV